MSGTRPLRPLDSRTQGERIYPGNGQRCPRNAENSPNRAKRAFRGCVSAFRGCVRAFRGCARAFRGCARAFRGHENPLRGTPNRSRGAARHTRLIARSQRGPVRSSWEHTPWSPRWRRPLWTPPLVTGTYPHAPRRWQGLPKDGRVSPQMAESLQDVARYSRGAADVPVHPEVTPRSICSFTRCEVPGGWDAARICPLNERSSTRTESGRAARIRTALPPIDICRTLSELEQSPQLAHALRPESASESNELLAMRSAHPTTMVGIAHKRASPPSTIGNATKEKVEARDANMNRMAATRSTPRTCRARTGSPLPHCGAEVPRHRMYSEHARQPLMN